MREVFKLNETMMAELESERRGAQGDRLLSGTR
jgi:hypothetical protein